MTTYYDAIIVGAGLAGLAAATHLAQIGHRPLLLERHGDLGGRARTDDLDGWLFNQGGHALYDGGVGHATLRSLGVEPAGETAPLAGGQLLLDGRPSPVPTNATGLLRSKALSPAGKVQFARLISRLPKLDPSAYGDVTVDEWLRDYHRDVQAVVKAFVRLTTYAAATNVTSADAAIAQLAGGQDGVLYLHDGWARLVGELADAATNVGAEIRRSMAVDSIATTEAGHTVTAGGEQFSAPAIIIAAGGPELTGRLLGVDPAVFGRVGSAPEAAVLDLALDAMPSRYRFVLGVDQPTFFSVHSPPARLSPKGKVAAVAMRYLAPDDDGSADGHRDSLEQIASIAGVGTPVRSRFLRRMTVTNGLPIASAGGIAGRPKVDAVGRPGVFVAGDWIGPRGLLADAALASGYDAAVQAHLAIRASLEESQPTGSERSSEAAELKGPAPRLVAYPLGTQAD